MRIRLASKVRISHGKRHRLLSSASIMMAVAGAFSVANPARAEEPAGAGQKAVQAQRAGQVHSLEEVTVTARKKEERLIDVPVAATVLGPEALTRYATTDLTQLQALTPGVEINRTGGGTPGGTIYIRGIGVYGPDYASEQPVAVVIDGVPITRGHAIDTGFFDQESIQILKGPQSLFFGKNSPAGVIAITSASPKDYFEGYVRASYGFNQKDPTIEGAVSIPVTSTLSVRMALRGEDMQGGFMKNGARPLAINPIPDPIFGGAPAPLPGANFDRYPQTKQLIGRFTAVWKPADNFDATFKILGSYYHNNSSFGNMAHINCDNGLHPQYFSLLTGIGYQDTGAACGGFNRITNQATPPAAVLKNFIGAPGDGKYYSLTQNILGSLTLNYRFPHVTLTSVTGAYHLHAGEFDNYDATIFAETPDAQLERSDLLTQEIRAATSFDAPVNFTVGVFYELERLTLWNTNRIFLLPRLPSNIPNQQAYAGASNSMIDYDINQSEDYSIFGQFDWKITDTVELTAGGRWTNAHKKSQIKQLMQWLDAFYLGAPGGPAVNSSLTPAGTVYDLSTKYQNFSPEVTFSWHPTSSVMLYAAYKSGFLAGGIANPGVVSNYTQLPQQEILSNLTFGQEKAKGGEFGLKGSFFGHRLSGDLTFYHYVYEGLQIATFHPLTTTFTIGNAASALNQGVELNANFRVNEYLSLRAAMEYNVLRYKSYSNAPCYAGQVAGCVNGAQDLSGETFGPAPASGSFGATYDASIANNYRLTLNSDVQIYGRSPLIARQPDTANPAHTVLNATAKIQQENGPWAVSLIGTNLTDAAYANYRGGQPLDAAQDLIGSVVPGREIILQLEYRF